MKKGSHHSVEARAKISAVQMGEKLSLETRRRMSVAKMGHTESPETRAKISAANVGKKHALGCHRSEEEKARLSASHIGPLNFNWLGGITPEKTRGYRHKIDSKRRALGFNPLNSWFVGCEGHHINKKDVIFLPRKLHRSVSHNQWTGRGMVEINVLAGQFLTEDWT